MLSEIGKKWSEISRIMTSRTENAVKNRYNAILRKTTETDNEVCEEYSKS